MLRSTVRRSTWLAFVLVLGTWFVGGSTYGQFRSAESSRPDTLQSLAPPPLDTRSSLGAFVHDAHRQPKTPVQFDPPSRHGVFLKRGQKLLLGTTGLIVHALCDTDKQDRGAVYPLSVRNVPTRTCAQCERLGNRAIDALGEGLFSNP